MVYSLCKYQLMRENLTFIKGSFKRAFDDTRTRRYRHVTAEYKYLGMMLPSSRITWAVCLIFARSY